MRSKVQQQSYNYNSSGERIGGQCGGVYWVPESKFAAVVVRAAHDPRVLNEYRFEPFDCPLQRRK